MKGSVLEKARQKVCCSARRHARKKRARQSLPTRAQQYAPREGGNQSALGQHRTDRRVPRGASAPHNVPSPPHPLPSLLSHAL